MGLAKKGGVEWWALTGGEGDFEGWRAGVLARLSSTRRVAGGWNLRVSVGRRIQEY